MYVVLNRARVPNARANIVFEVFEVIVVGLLLVLLVLLLCVAVACWSHRVR